MRDLRQEISGFSSSRIGFVGVYTEVLLAEYEIGQTIAVEINELIAYFFALIQQDDRQIPAGS
jgi:hypothetical protein